MKQNRNTILTGASIFGVLALMYNATIQLEEIEHNPNQKFDFTRFLKYGLKGFLIGGTSTTLLLLLIALFNDEELEEEDFDATQYLKGVLESYQPNELDETFKVGLKVMDFLNKDFKTKIKRKPKFQGSYSQGTALEGISDLDILVGFKRHSFVTLKEMYDSVYYSLNRDFEDTNLVKIRKQRRSIGIILNIKGKESCIDVVPVRITNTQKGNRNYNLYDRNTHVFGKSSRIKMNPTKQASFGKKKDGKVKVVSFLKIIKAHEYLPLKSIYITELTKRAFEKNKDKIPKRIDKQIIMTLEYIRENIERVRITSPDNSNQVISEYLDDVSKSDISDSVAKIICDIESSPIYYRQYFPENSI